jgi:hypothetical protein
VSCHSCPSGRRPARRAAPSHSGLAQLQKLSTRSRRYLTLNLAGSAILAADAAAGDQWGFLLLEGAWALVSLLGLTAATRGSWRGLARRLRPR